MNWHAKMGLTTYNQLVSRGTGRPLRRTPTARIICRCRWVAVRHASTYDGAKRLAEIALKFHIDGHDEDPKVEGILVSIFPEMGAPS